MTRQERPVLLYDGDCGFCTKSVGTLARWLPAVTDYVPYQATDLSALGVTAERAGYEVLWVGPSGRVHGGAQAVARLLVDCDGPLAVVGGVLRLPPLGWLAHGVYRLVSNNRHRLPGTTPACSRPREEWP